VFLGWIDVYLPWLSFSEFTVELGLGAVLYGCAWWAVYFLCLKEVFFVEI
jgi:hypothetical protein